MKTFIAMALLALTISACAPIKSDYAPSPAKGELLVTHVQESPDKYTGVRTVWKGVILSIENLDTGSEMEVIEIRPSSTRRDDNEYYGGRFLVESSRFIDPLVFRKDMTVSITGTIKGITVKKIGQTDYPYPVVVLEDISSQPEARFVPYPSNYPPIIFLWPLSPFRAIPWHHHGPFRP